MASFGSGDCYTQPLIAECHLSSIVLIDLWERLFSLAHGLTRIRIVATAIIEQRPPVGRVHVLSAQAWYEHFDSVQLMDKFEGTKVVPPELMPWGLLITYVWDPAGVLLHFAQDPKAKTGLVAAPEL
ncbi:MAG: hypothetical protein ACI915_003863 [Gammaproteobacteria bacterium]